MADIPISVVMPTYNDAPYLKEAIDSILNQTFSEFEFIIVNDASTDETEEIILSYHDKRIRYLKNEVNMGNAFSRNKGMEAATGKYIVVMDSDDMAAKNRFALQYYYLEKHPEIGILGGAKIFFDEKHWFKRYYPADPDYIKSYLFFKNPVGQPTVMMRSEAIVEYKLYYQIDYENGEDYELWYRAAMAGVKISNLKAVLLYYRQSESQISNSSNIRIWGPNNVRIFKNKLNDIGITLSDRQFEVLYTFIRGRIGPDRSSYLEISGMMDQILKQNKKSHLFLQTYFKAVLFSHRLRLLKCYYLEKGRLFQFLVKAIILSIKTGFPAVFLFWKNEGKYGRNFGADKIYSTPFSPDSANIFSAD